MFLLREDMDNNDITLLSTKSALMRHLHARMIAGVDIESCIDVFPVDLGSRIEISNSIVLLEANT